MFLKNFNGGEIFIPGTVLACVNIEGEKRKNNESYLEDSANPSKRPPNMPDNLFIIADMNYGDSICFDPSANVGDTCRAVQWSNEDSEISRTWNTFKEWLLDAMDEGKLIVNYDGTDKNIL